MKRLYPLLFILFACVTAEAQAPQAFNYQAIARDNAGAVLAGKSISIRMSVLNGSASGTNLYQESFSLTTNAFGLFSLSIGTGTRISGDFPSIDWGTSTKFLQTEIDLHDGRGFVVLGTSQLVSVPYALYALNSGGGNNSWTIAGNDIHNGNAGNVGIGTTNPLARLHVKDSTVLFTGGTGVLTTNPRNTPMSGSAGIRTFWYPDKAAFRTGGLDNGLTFIPVNGNFDFFGGLHNWDKDSIGAFSFASGYNTQAKGLGATAIGVCNNADGDMSFAGGFHNSASGFSSFVMGSNSIARNRSFIFGYRNFAVAGSFAMGNFDTALNLSYAFGVHSVASGNTSFTIGNYVTASGENSIAIGNHLTASGNSSIALGNNLIASGNSSFLLGADMDAGGRNGVFLIGDASGRHRDVPILPTDDNQFTAFFQNGYRLFTNTDEDGIPTGVILNTEDNAWSAISDSTKKSHFLALDGEQVLQKIGGFNALGSWSYKGQDPKIHRHYGPMAQDFHHAFGNDGLGVSGNDTLINSADMSGVLFIAAHALVQRTNEMNKKAIAQQEAIGQLLAANKRLSEENEALREDFARTNELLRSQYAKTNEALGHELATMKAQLDKLSLLVAAKVGDSNFTSSAKPAKN